MTKKMLSAICDIVGLLIFVITIIFAALDGVNGVDKFYSVVALVLIFVAIYSGKDDDKC